MPLEPQWKEALKIIIITAILSVIIMVINNTIISTPSMWGMIGLINWLYLIPTVIFIILIYRWAKKYNYI